MNTSPTRGDPRDVFLSLIPQYAGRTGRSLNGRILSVTLEGTGEVRVTRTRVVASISPADLIDPLHKCEVVLDAIEAFDQYSQRRVAQRTREHEHNLRSAVSSARRCLGPAQTRALLLELLSSIEPSIEHEGGA